MKIAISGASGGIGSTLMRTLGDTHELTGIVRTLPHKSKAQPGANYVAFSDKSGLENSLAQAEIVFHGALDQKAKGKAFLSVNQAMNAELLSLALGENVTGQADHLQRRCKLFIYVSSQVVYSGAAPQNASGYAEDDPLCLTDKIDAYSRLKILGERDVIAACSAAGVDYLIVRPTVVMGPGMAWSEDIVAGTKWAPFGIQDRTMNLIHVDDLCAQVARLIEEGARNEIFNLGAQNVKSQDYFDEVGRINGRKTLYVPEPIMAILGRALPSTFWFFAQNVAIDADKIARVTGLKIERSITEYFPRIGQQVDGQNIDVLKRFAKGTRGFQVEGQGYSRWFNQKNGALARRDLVSMKNFSGIMELTKDLVRVKSGTQLTEILDALAEKNLTIRTLPEFSGVSAGACFFVDVHGSSAEYFSMADLIESVVWLDDDGRPQNLHSTDADWDEMRRRRDNLIVTEVVFRCSPTRILQNEISFVADDNIQHWLRAGYRESFSTTLQWYPRRKQMMVYAINPVEDPHAPFSKARAPFRGSPYSLQKFMLFLTMRGKNIQVDQAHNILAPWKSVPAKRLVDWLLRRKFHSLRDLEMLLSAQDGAALVADVQARVADGRLRMGKDQGIGLRFSHNQTSGEDFIWFEFVSGNAKLVDQVIGLAKQISTGRVAFHHGKYRPN